LITIFSDLLVLYIAACLSISVVGGAVDFLYHTVLQKQKPYFSAEDAFKIALLRNNIPMLVVDVFSRIPVNIVDRFIVIFGGFFTAMGLGLFNNPKGYRTSSAFFQAKALRKCVFIRKLFKN
jgi:hypothetical protein